MPTRKNLSSVFNLLRKNQHGTRQMEIDRRDLALLAITGRGKNLHKIIDSDK